MKATIEDVYNFYNKYPQYIGDIKANTRFGYKDIQYCDVTAKDSDVYEVSTKNGMRLKCSPNHRLFTESGWKELVDIERGDKIDTIDGYSDIESISLMDYKDDLFDIQVEGVHEYYSNGIVSHNSSFLEATAYALYGKLLSGMKLAQAINSVNKKNLLTKVKFEKHGEEWEVIRGEKPKKFEIYRNGDLMDQYANARDQQKFLEIILGMDFKLFTQLVVLNKERYVPFMELSAGDRRKVVEDILDINIFSEMNEVCKQHIKELQREEANLEKDREITKTKMDGQQKLIREIQDSIASASESVQQELDEKRKSVDELKTKEESIQSQLDAIDLSGHKKVKTQIKDFEKLADQFTRQIDESKKMAKFFQENDHCPTCEQPIDQELKVAKANESDDKCVEVQSIIGEMMEELEECAQKNKEFEQATERWSELNASLQQVMFQISSVESDIKHLLDRSEKAQESQKLEESITTFDELEESLESLSCDLKDTIAKREQYEVLRDLLKDDGIKATIVREYNALMNRKINEYLQAMEFYINLSLDENFKETFHAMHKEGFSYENLSTGQKCRVNLAILLALMDVASVKNSVVTNMLCVDEILEPLDSEGVKHVTRLFKEKLPEKNIFCITQRRDEFQDLFESQIDFKLNGQFTEMV